jgi:hypothetical protein
MSEQLICETVAEKRSAELQKLHDRIARLEGRLDVLVTRVEYLTRDSVNRDDLEQLWKRVVRYVARAMREMLSGFRTEFRTELGAHGADIKRSGRKHTRIVMKRAGDEAAKTRRRLLQYGLLIVGLFLAVTGKDGAFAIFKWATTGFPI